MRDVRERREPRRVWTRGAALAVLTLAIAGCRMFGGRPIPAGSAGGSSMPAPRALLERYARAGLLAAPEPVTFVGVVRALGGPSADSTLTLVALSLPTRSLSFVREGDRYRASYDVVVEFRQVDRVIRRLTARQAVRVGTFTETVRDDESVLFQEFALVAPGSYDVSVTVRDSATGARGVSTLPVYIPQHTPGRLAAPVTVHQATPRTRRDSIPDLVANPRGSLLLGRDTTLRVYLEGYALPPRARVGYVVQDERGRELLRDTASLARPDTGVSTTPPERQVTGAVVSIRVKRLEVGLYWLGSWRVGTADSVWVPFFILPSDGLVLRSERRGGASSARVANARLIPAPARRPRRVNWEETSGRTPSCGPSCLTKFRGFPK